MGRLLVPTLCLTSGLLQAIYVILDVYTAVHIVTDAFVLSLLSMWIGLPVSAIALLLMNIRFRNRKVGKRADPAYKGIELPSKANRRVLGYVAISGAAGAVGLLFYFYAATIFDPSVIAPLMQFVIVYLVVVDLYVDKEIPEMVEIQSLLMITMGSYLVTTNSGGIDLAAFAVVMVGLNGTTVIVTFFQKKAVSCCTSPGKRMDSLNIRFYFVVFMTLFTTIMTLPFMDAARWQLLFDCFLKAIPVISISMALAFFSFVLYVRALAIAKMAVVSALLASSVLMTALLTLLLSILKPGLLGDVSGSDQSIWTIKMIGALLAMTGIAALALSEVRMYIFFDLKLICDLSAVTRSIRDVKGVQNVAVISGTYDLVAYIQLRTLGKAQALISQRLAHIDGIRRATAMPIIAEWVRGN